MLLGTGRTTAVIKRQPEGRSHAQLLLEHLERHRGDWWKQGDLNNDIPFFLCVCACVRARMRVCVDGRHHSWVTSSTHLQVALEQINKSTLTARRQMSFGRCVFPSFIAGSPKQSASGGGARGLWSGAKGLADYDPFHNRADL